MTPCRYGTFDCLSGDSHLTLNRKPRTLEGVYLYYMNLTTLTVFVLATLRALNSALNV